MHTKRWVINPPITPEADEALIRFPPVLKQILFNRGLASYEEARTFCEPCPVSIPTRSKGTNPGTRLAQMGIKEALETGAQVLATACPFCLLTLEEAVKHLNAEEQLRVMDIAEIARQAL